MAAGAGMCSKGLARLLMGDGWFLSGNWLDGIGDGMFCLVEAADLLLCLVVVVVVVSYHIRDVWFLASV